MMLWANGLVAQTTIQSQVSASSDDAEEYIWTANNEAFRTQGSMDVASSDIELGTENPNGVNPQISGLRFNGLDIPQGALIQSAYIQFTVDNTNKNEDPAQYIIYAEDQLNPATFSEDSADITSRNWSMDSVSWNVDANTWTVAGNAGMDEKTADLKRLVQYLVNNPGWEQGNSMAFFIKGTGVREAESFDGDEAKAAKLIVTYTPVTPFMAQIASSSDDAEEYIWTDKNEVFRTQGSMDLASSDIELGFENRNGVNPQITGLRFVNLGIPQGAFIQSAYIQFTVDNTNKNEDPANYLIYAEDNVTPATFSADSADITSRTWTTNTVEWNMDANTWTEVGAAGMDEKTADIRSLVQHLVNKGEWTEGNAMAFFIEGTGVREAESFDGDEAKAAKLIINYIPVANYVAQVGSSSDDAEEYIWTENNQTFRTQGSMDITSSDIELGAENPNGVNPQITGLRFGNLDIPANAIIESAYIQFTVDNINKNEDPANYFIFAEDNVTPAIFTEDSANITSRAWTIDSIPWTVEANTWTEVGAAGMDEKTSDITSLVQYLVNKEGWEPGKAMAFFIRGTGVREAESFDGSEEGAARLVVKFLQGEITYKPELVREIPNQELKEGWMLNLDVKPFFRDLDSPLEFSITGNSGTSLPMGVEIENGIITGSFNKATALTIEVWAKSDGDSVMTSFMALFQPNQTPLLTQISSLDFGGFDEGAAEISAFDPLSQRLFVTNSAKNTIEIVSMKSPESMVSIDSIDISAIGGYINSVAAFNGLIVAAIEAPVKQDSGFVYAFDTNGVELWHVTVGALPDMVAFNEDGSKIVVACEGEPSGDYLNDPEGSVGIIDVATQAVSIARFTAFNGESIQNLKAQGIRIYGPNATVAQDLEPEYVTIKGNTAYITCQENNAIAIVDIPTATVTDLMGLGYKDHSLPGMGLDIPKTDKAFISNWPFKGVYMPDAISSYTVGGKTYLLTANEGDAREYEYDVDSATTILAYTDEAKIKNLKLDPITFPNYEIIQDLAGDLKTSIALVDTTADGLQTEIYTFGARSFTIWDAATGDVVFESGDQFEQITASLYPFNFNAADDDNSAKDRSDDKGPEPEAITVGEVDGKMYAFIGLERMGGIMVYDITDPSNVTFVEYTNNRNFATHPEDEEDIHGDNGPEGLIFIPATQSPNNTALLVVSNEVSGTVTTYSIGEAQPQFTLAIYHNNDGESDLLPDSITVNGVRTTGGSISQFKTTLDSMRTLASNRGYESIMLSSGDNFLAGLEYNASQANNVYYDAMALDALDYDAIDLGNHDFDFGTQILAEFIGSFQTNLTPYLSANLSFENVPELQALVNNDRIKPSTVVTVGGEQIGVIGLTTPLLPTISSPGNTIVSTAIIDSVQKQIDLLTGQGINKIILISHLQNLNEEIALAKALRDIDIIIAGGGDELLANNPDLGKPYNINPAGTYPVISNDLDSNEVYIVTTPGNYRYLGNLLVDFDAEGHVVKVHPSSDLVLVTGPSDPTLKANIEDPIVEYIGDLATNVIAIVEDSLDFRRETIRHAESNGGNLFADALLWQAQQTHETFGVAMPQVAIQNSGGLRIESIIEEGDFTEDLTYEVAAFTNIVSVVENIAPEKFLELMEFGVADAPNLNGRFPQISGFVIVYDPAAPAGDRIISITLNDGTKVVENGEVVSGASPITMATIDFTANGGDGYPFSPLTYTTLGATYQQAFLNYLVDGLNGVVAEEDYPWGMNERIIEEISLAPAVDSVVVDFGEECPEDLAGWTLFHTVDNLVSRCAGNEYIQFNGHSSGANGIGESWLITPRINFDDVDDLILSFTARNQYDRNAGLDVAVLYSSDYSGLGDPTGASWTTITAATNFLNNSPKPSSGPTASGEIDLSEITSEAYIAIVYYSDNTGGGGSSSFYLYDFAVKGPAPILDGGIKTIAEIQGTGMASPFESYVVETSGIVTAKFSGSEPFPGAGYTSNLTGFYIQNNIGDGNPATSEGLFIDANESVAVGDSITIDGLVAETFGLTQLTDVTSVTVHSSGNAVEVTTITLPLTSRDAFESFEGMWVEFTNTMTVTENRNLDNFGEVRLAAGGLLYQPTQVVDPNDADVNGVTASGNSNVAAVNAQLAANRASNFILDDAKNGSNPNPIPYLGADNSLRAGSTVDNLKGIFSYGFSEYRLIPTAAPSFTYAPVDALPTFDNANLVVASFNVLNYFNGNGNGGGFPTSRGASNFADFEKQSQKIVAALKEMDADVVGLIEIENEEDAGNISAIETLVTELNEAIGTETYAFIETGMVKRADNTADEIKNGFIYKTTTVEPFGAYAVLNNSFDANYHDAQNRPALAQSFKAIASGAVFTAVVNHFKSKGSDCDALGDFDDNDGQGECNRTRTKAAGTLAAWLATDPTNSLDGDVIILGDLNAYSQEDPMDTLRAVGFNSLTNDTDYSYVFNGQYGSLDNALVNDNLASQVAGAKTWHINSIEPDLLSYRGVESAFEATPYWSSDHDPVLIGLNLIIVGIETKEVAGLSLYPNPTENVIMFNQAVSGTVINEYGVEIAQLNQVESFNFEQFGNGVYILRTENGDSHKIIVVE